MISAAFSCLLLNSRFFVSSTRGHNFPNTLGEIPRARCRYYFGLLRFLEKTTSAAITIAPKPMVLADSDSIPSNMQRLVTKLFVRRAITISRIGRIILYFFICATLSYVSANLILFFQCLDCIFPFDPILNKPAHFYYKQKRSCREASPSTIVLR
jgi:hypothetical protein